MVTATSSTGTSTIDQTLKDRGISRTVTVGGATSQLKTTGTKTTLDQNDFLSLMTAQLKNQDPFNPVDNTQMVAQMATFSQVSGISQMNSTLQGIATRLGATTAADAMSYVGRTVLTAGSTAYERSSGGIAGAVELEADATDVTVSIADKDGVPVKSMKLGNQEAGTIKFDWNGKDAAGNAIANGPYTVSVSAVNSSTVNSATQKPQSVKAATLVWAPVESASLPTGGDPVLNVTGVGEIKPADVRQVS